MISLGVEQFIDSPPEWLTGKRLGLLCNQASTDSKLRHSRDLIQNTFSGQLACLFSPQHGFFAEKQDNMIESNHARDPHSGLPVFSLYGEVRKPTKEMFDRIDVLLVDLIDVGTRVYTFLYTLAYCLEAASEFGKRVVVLDRPNPIDGIHVEGNLLKDDCRSFVGLYPIPMRHGLTIGELALFINREFNINASLDIITMQGWQRSMLFADTGLPFVFPSPNMPRPETALVYPGQVLWEGTTVSEGRGTALPFELFGAPYFDHDRILEFISPVSLPGCILRPIVFEPTSNKWKENRCNGFHVHVTNTDTFKPYRTSLALLQAVMHLHKNTFDYKKPPYEYEYHTLPMDLILGDTSVRSALENGEYIIDIERSWETELKQFDALRRKYYLYT